MVATYFLKCKTKPMFLLSHATKNWLRSNFECSKDMFMKSSNKHFFCFILEHNSRNENNIGMKTSQVIIFRAGDDSLGYLHAFLWATIAQSQLYFTNVAGYICASRYAWLYHANNTWTTWKDVHVLQEGSSWCTSRKPREWAWITWASEPELNPPPTHQQSYRNRPHFIT